MIRISRNRPKYRRVWGTHFGVLYKTSIRRKGVPWITKRYCKLEGFIPPSYRKGVYSYRDSPFKRRRYFRNSFRDSIWTKEK